MSTYFIVFGSTGNLMYKKLLPAFSALLKQELYPKDLKIIAVGRRDYDTQDYLEEIQDQVSSKINWEDLKNRIEYFKLDVETLEDYQRLAKRVEDSDQTRMVYLAVPPKLISPIAKGIYEGGIVAKGDASQRIVFEKPFGEDLESAKQINKMLWNYFDENQMYRIDHYLGKEMIQNILTVRFANRLFQESWSNHAIESVTLIAKEDEGVLSRAGYYDKVGAIKDMVQSHLMQMAALIAMEDPNSLDADSIRNQKVQAIKALEFDRKMVFGQYDGYRKEDGVDPSSETETLFFGKAMIHTKRFEGVPFYFFTGKDLGEKKSEIILKFKRGEYQDTLFSNKDIPNNKLIIKIAPEDGIEFQMNTKAPGLDTSIEIASLDYCHLCRAVGNLPEAYEKLLLDLYSGQTTLFARWDEIETAWEKITGLKKHKEKLFVYPSFDQVKEKINTEYEEGIL